MKNEKGLFIKNSNKFRVPRKIKKQIPKDTFYCYTPTSGMKHFKDGTYGYSIKTCPLYTWRKLKDIKPDYLDEQDLIKWGEEVVGYCKLIKCEIDDQCKSCGLKENLK